MCPAVPAICSRWRCKAARGFSSSSRPWRLRSTFERRADRLHLDEGATAYHLVPERTASLDYEVFDILSVRGVRDDSEEQTFLPLFAAPQAEPGAERAYYSAVREPRLPSDRGKREGPRSGYVGTETFLSLVDSREVPFRGALRQLAVQVRCTNRDLPLFMPTGQAQGELTLNASAPIEAIHIAAGPSRPQSAMREGGSANWAVSRATHASTSARSAIDCA